MKTSPCPDFIDYWERGTAWCLGVRIWADRCQAIKCDPDQPGSSLVLTEDSYPLPFAGMDGSGPVPVIVFAIATHMMLHPDSDLVDVLSGKKTLWEAQQSAEPDDDGPSISGSDVART
jgi:hypothetical protein